MQQLSPNGIALLKAWVAWDASASRVEMAQRMEDACQAAAAQLDTDATRLRVVLSAFARRGVLKREALLEIGL